MSIAPTVAGERRNLEIEVLRCIAIVFTLMQHVHLLLPDPKAWLVFPGRVLGFWTGVDLFFVVSGFVIMNTLLDVVRRRERGEPVRSLLYAFWVRRAFRLLPTAWLWLLVPMLVSMLLARIDILPPPLLMWRGALTAAFNVDNIAAAWCVSGHGGSLLCQSRLMSGHYWSLSLEEQFYIVLPLLLVLIPRRGLVPLALFGVVVCVFIPRPLFSVASFFRIDGFLWGVVLALLRGTPLMALFEPRWLARWPLRVIVTTLLVFALARVPVVAAGLGIDLVGGHRTWSMAAIFLVCALLVWIASWDRGYLFGRGRALAPFVWVGSRSYSLYVIHLPLFLLAHNALAVYGSSLPAPVWNVSVLAGTLILLLALSEANFHLVETPLRDRGRAIARRWRRETNGPSDKPAAAVATEH